MTAVHFTLIAILLYSIENVLISRFLKTVSPVVSIACMHAVVAVLALVYIFCGGGRNSQMPTLLLPKGYQWWILALIGVLLATADYCYINALGTGRLSTITTIACLLPVMATIINILCDWTGGSPDQALPTWNEIIGWLLGVAAVVVVTFKPFK